MKRPQMVLFDYGNTIIEETIHGFDKGNEALLAVAADNPRHITIQTFQAKLDEIIYEMSSKMGCTNRFYQPYEISWCSIYRYAAAYFGITFRQPFEVLEEIYWDAATSGRPAEHIEELLTFLQEQHIRTGVVSNIMLTGATLRRRIEKLLPAHHFSFILASSDYAFRKPEKALFELALQQAGLPAEEVWFCGDNPICDVEGAKRAGMQPIWYRKTFREKADLTMRLPPDQYLVVDDWSELITMIQQRGVDDDI